jgi:hypothetical protein
MGRVKAVIATGAKAAAKRSELSGQMHGARAVMARLAGQAARVQHVEKELARERETRLELERKIALLEARLGELGRSLEVVIT